MLIKDPSRFGLIVVIGMLLPCKAVEAQEKVRRVSLEEALELFAANNLELRVSRADAAETAGLARQARSYPNPVAAAEHESLSNGADLRDTESYLTLSQQIDWPWRYARRRVAGSRIAEAAYAQQQADSIRFAFEVKRAFVEAGLVERTHQVVSDVAEVFRKAERDGAARYGEGDVSGYELRRIRVERVGYEMELRQATIELAQSRRHLAALLVPDSADLLVAPIWPPANTPPSVSPSDFVARALSRRAEITAAELSVQAADATTSLARSAALPDPTLVVGYKRISGGLHGGIVGLEIPLPLLDRKGGDADAASARLDAAESRRSTVRREVENDVRTSVEAYASLTRVDRLIADTLLAGSADILDIALAAYSEGEMTLLELLDAAGAFRDAQTAAAHLIAELWIAYYDLERATGGPLPAESREEDL